MLGGVRRRLLFGWLGLNCRSNVGSQDLLLRETGDRERTINETAALC